MTKKNAVPHGIVRSSRFAVALVAAAGTIGFIAPTASATALEGYSAPVQQASIDATRAAGGLSESAAVEALRVQQSSIGTLGSVTAGLGDRAAGSYLDERGLPVVNVLDQATADEVTRSGATAKLVSRSVAQLDAARGAVEALPSVAHTSIGTDVRTNQVVVTIAEEADDAEAAALTAEAARHGDAVRVATVAGGMHKSILNGEAITGGGSRCSAGFNVNSGGALHVLDAGHCTGAVASWNIGPSVGASFPDNDYGLIRNDTGDGPGAVTLWDGTSQAITSAADATVGQQVCKSGSTTNLTCGSVQATNVTVNYAEGPVYQAVQTSAGVGPGDSGGCLFSGSVGLGITSGMGGGSSYFQPVVEALNAYGMSLN
ncbi:trypsin [Amycolatopsis antarctica]|uniref:Trypsin n=1 Tax=Amycolatopsis antarctica TaxID=1854586 RepID=A0A263DBQ5_9PSEU|nr:S1 family peptidase [Amycolatopsis antarctica]OZM74825.1 trypsin [Amycolatopsis antarctica]